MCDKKGMDDFFEFLGFQEASKESKETNKANGFNMNDSSLLIKENIKNIPDNRWNINIE